LEGASTRNPDSGVNGRDSNGVGAMMQNLMACKSCGAQISKTAATCPQRGHVYKPSQPTFYQNVQSLGCGTFILVITALLLISKLFH
jgi:hypothetical protein